MKIVKKIAVIGASSLIALSGFVGVANATGGVPSGTTPSATTPSGSEATATSSYWKDGLSIKTDKTRVGRGDKLVITVGKGAKTSMKAEFALEVHSKVYNLGKFKKEEGKDLKVEWTVPQDMELGTHKVIIPESDGAVLATFEVVKTLANTGIADYTGIMAGLALAGVSGIAVRRRLTA